MVELKGDALVFRFPEVHADAVLRITFQRTLRIPDDGSDYPLPPGLGSFPLRHVDDFAARVPAPWMERGGVMMPLYQSEAMWLSFSSPGGYPFAVKVAAGKQNAVTGDAWDDRLHGRPQDYLTVPGQPWLDGFCVARGRVKQFVAMPLGDGCSVEEQLTGRAEHGGVQLLVAPLKKELWQPRRLRESFDDVICETAACFAAPSAYDMGLGAGGSMRQEIYDDDRSIRDYDVSHRSRCFVHLANSLVWRSITGQQPPTTPPTSEEYTRAGLPWFEYYADRSAVGGGDRLKDVRTVTELGVEKGTNPLPENTSATPANVVTLRAGLGRDEVRTGAF